MQPYLYALHPQLRVALGVHGTGGLYVDRGHFHRVAAAVVPPRITHDDILDAIKGDGLGYSAAVALWKPTEP